MNSIYQSRINDPDLDLSVSEWTKTSIKFLQNYIPKERIFCDPDYLNIMDDDYDVIMLNAVDYCFNEPELIKFLSSVKRILKSDGILVLTSASYYDKSSIRQQIISNVKNIIKGLVHDNFLTI